MSHKALNGIEPQTCLDDLESFYYVLLYLARRHMRTEYSGLPPPLDSWEQASASEAKHGYFLLKFRFVTDPRLGKPFQTLVERLHSVFRDMFLQAILAEERGEPPPAVNHEEVYDMMLSHVRDAIDDLNLETQNGVSTPRSSNHEEGNVDAQKGGSSLSEANWRSIITTRK